MTAADFNEAYLNAPPWEIDRPQPAVMALAEEGGFTGRVLDVGCGSGENSLYLASRGLPVLGIDAAPTPVGRARAKAAERGLPVEFGVADAFDLGALGRHFDTVLDSAFLHILGGPGDAERRHAYATQLALVLPSRGRLHLLQISERTTAEFPKISSADIAGTFTDGWTTDRIQPATYTTTNGESPAWLVSLHRR